MIKVNWRIIDVNKKPMPTSTEWDACVYTCVIWTALALNKLLLLALNIPKITAKVPAKKNNAEKRFVTILIFNTFG